MTLPETKKTKAEERLVRIMQKDIEGKMNIYSGLTKIKGISWAMSNAVCRKIGINKQRKIGSLSEQEVKQIEEFLKKPEVPSYLKNRRRDFETGENIHFLGTDLDLRKEFDIKRLKKIKSYRGVRHLAGLPVRGQRTRSHFRKKRARSTGIKEKTKQNEKKA